MENSQEAQSDVAAKLSQSIYWVESILSKCHEEGELLFFTIRTPDPPQVTNEILLHVHRVGITPS